jgi:hypothetical protein
MAAILLAESRPEGKIDYPNAAQRILMARGRA